MALNITNENYQELIEGDKPVVIDFWAEWCGPCRMITPIIEELANEYEGQVAIGKCNVDENNDIAVKYSVRSIPTVIFIKGGEVVDKQVGSAGKDVFKNKVEGLLK